jgi:hypothetical protein
MASWNDGTAKSSVLDFVQRVMTEGRKDFALVPERAGPAESGVLSSTGEKSPLHSATTQGDLSAMA